MVLTAQTACTLGTVRHLPCPEIRGTGGLKPPPSGNPLMEETTPFGWTTGNPGHAGKSLGGGVFQTGQEKPAPD